MNKRHIHLICIVHLDPVWLWQWQEGAAEAISTFRTAAELCEKNKTFIFNHNEAILYRDAPKLFKRIQKLVKRGKWHIMGGWYHQPDCNMPSGESFIRTHIVPQYKKIVDMVHSYDKPCVLHSCGCVFDVMEDIIEIAGIDVKHSNEDAIAMFDVWTEKYGGRIANFGGIDMDVLCQNTEEEIQNYTFNILEKTFQCGGVAYGSSNSIPHYVPVEGYLAMNKAIREFKDERL